MKLPQDEISIERLWWGGNKMITILIGIAGFFLALALIAVYSALVLAHRTDNMIKSIMDDNQHSNHKAFGQT